jgi:hypothetical protein
VQVIDKNIHKGVIVAQRDPQMNGKWTIIIGLCFCAVGLIGIAVAFMSGRMPEGGRAESAVLFAIPVGVVMIIWGLIARARGK